MTRREAGRQTEHDPAPDGAVVGVAAPPAANGDRATVLVAGFAGALGTGLREVVAHDRALTVIGGDDTANLPALVAAHRPHVALVNHDALGNLVELRDLVAGHPSTRVVVAVMRLNRERDARLLDAGVRIVVPVTIDVLELCGVLRLVARGLVGPSRPPSREATAGLGVLTRREAEVMNLLVLCRTAREIAHELKVSEATVHTHRRHIYEKLGVHSRAELADHVSRLSAREGRDTELARSHTRDRAAFSRRARGADRPTDFYLRAAFAAA